MDLKMGREMATSIQHCKCKMVHLGTETEEEVYRMNNHVNDKEDILLKTNGNKDLGVWIDKTVKPSNYVAQAVKKANQLLGLIRRTFTYMECRFMRQLFTSVVGPHLEYANVVWHPYQKRTWN
jgi:hypothetical protein